MRAGLNHNRAMPARLSAFVMWALVAAGLVFWGYRLWAQPLNAPAQVQAVAEGDGMRGDLTRLFGAAAAPVDAVAVPVAESSRFRLYGVLAPMPAIGAANPSTAGVALIAVDGKPAKAYAVGSRVDAELVLKSISRRSASIGPAQGGPSVVLELPPPVAPMTGTLPRATADGDAPRAIATIPQTGPPVMLPQTQRPAFQPPPQPADEADEEDEPAAPPPQRRAGPANPASR